MTDTAILGRVVRGMVSCGVIVSAIGCHGLLDVSDPTRLNDADIANASGANARRLNASNVFIQNMPFIVGEVAAITDEWTYDFPATLNVVNDRNVQLDQRSGDQLATSASDPHMRALSQAFVQSEVAIPAVRAYTPDSLQGDFLAQLYGIRGYVVLQMAEDICPGFPVDDIVDNQVAYGGPITTDSAVALASAQLDSAIKYARDSTRFVTLARVVKGRALLDRGKYTEAAAVVAPVPTAAVYTAETQRAFMAVSYCPTCEVVGVGDHEGTNGLPFGSANDVRVPLQRLGVRRTNTNDTLYVTTKGRSSADQLVLASGIEARLIQAEAALHEGQSWKPILDSLRATVGLDTLADPGTPKGRVDMLYQERAFWLFMTGRRLGDLRRLIKNYGRTPESVFPTGAYPGGNGGSYGTATAIPFSASNQQRYNPHITSGCMTP